MSDNHELNKWRRLSYLQALFGVESVLTPVLTIFYLNYVGYSFEQFSTMLALCFLFLWGLEIPSATLSDKLGRKVSLILGNSIYIIALLAVVLLKKQIPLAVVAFLFSLGSALAGKTFQSMMYDAYADQNAQEEFHHTMAKTTSISLIAASVAAAVGGWLADYNLALPIVVDIWLLALATLALYFWVKEPRLKSAYTNANYKSYWSIMRSGILNAFSSWYMINFIICAAVIFATLRVSFNFYQPLLLAVELRPSQIGLLFSGIFLLSALAAYMFSRVQEKYLASGLPEILFFSLFLVSSITIIDSSNAMMVITAICLHQIVRGMYPSLTSYILNSNIENGRTDRTTTLATASFVRVAITGVATYCSGVLSENLGAATIFSGLSLLSTISIFFLLVFRVASREVFS